MKREKKTTKQKPNSTYTHKYRQYRPQNYTDAHQKGRKCSTMNRIIMYSERYD